MDTPDKITDQASGKEKSAPKRVDLGKLRHLLATRFDEGELRTLCFDLGVDYEDLPGAGKANKARDLVKYLDHRNRIDELLTIGRQFRPDVPWEDVFVTTPPALPTPPSTPLERLRRWNWQLVGLLALALALVIVVVWKVRGAGDGLPPATETASSLVSSTPSAEPGVTPPPTDTPTLAAPSLRLSLISTHFPEANVRDILLADGDVWVAMDWEGVSRLNGGWHHYGTVDGHILEPTTLAQDPDGQIWVGDFERGLTVLSPAGQVVATHTHTTTHLAQNKVAAVAFGKKGEAWIGTWRAVQQLSLQQGEWSTVSLSIGSEGYHVNDLVVDKQQGYVWLALCEGGIRHFEPETQVAQSYTHDDTCTTTRTNCLLSDCVKTLYIDRQGRKWVGTDQGLSILDDGGDGPDQWWGFTMNDGLPSSDVRAIVTDDADRVYIGTTGGLAVLDMTPSMLPAPEFTEGSPPADISALAFDDDSKTLWIGTLGKGLSVWSVSEGTARLK